jgi:transcriptional regulator with XRE-family HTH domain
MAVEYLQPFGVLLKRFRLAARLKQEELAERAELSARTISDLERGVSRAPRKETLRLLAEALGLSEADRALLVHVAQGQSLPRTFGRAVSSAPARPTFPLVGRRRELHRLDSHLAGDGPPLLLLAGEPGIGKSRLLRETAQQAVMDGWTVLAGGCHRKSGQEPYTPLLDALAGYLRRHPRLKSAMPWLAALGWWGCSPSWLSKGCCPAPPGSCRRSRNDD